jgi:hypothetical protein
VRGTGRREGAAAAGNVAVAARPAEVGGKPSGGP